MTFTRLIALAACVMLVGCGTTLTARPADQDSDEPKGMPYYLPRPYLVITKNFSFPGAEVIAKKTVSSTPPKEDDNPSGKKDDGKAEGKTAESKPDAGSGGSAASKPDAPTTTTTTTTTPTMHVPVAGKTEYVYQVVYLPDLSNKYMLNMSSGSGTTDMSFELKDGWMFTGLNLKTDAKTAETIQATGDAAAKLAALFLTGGASAIPQALAQQPGEGDGDMKNLAWSPPEPTRSSDDSAEFAIWVYRFADNGGLELVLQSNVSQSTLTLNAFTVPAAEVSAP